MYPDDSCDGTLMSERRWMCASLFRVWGSLLPLMVIVLAAVKNTQLCICTCVCYVHVLIEEERQKINDNVKSILNTEESWSLKVYSPVTALKPPKLVMIQRHGWMRTVLLFASYRLCHVEAYNCNRMPLKWLVECHIHAETRMTWWTFIVELMCDSPNNRKQMNSEWWHGFCALFCNAVNYCTPCDHLCGILAASLSG